MSSLRDIMAGEGEDEEELPLDRETPHGDAGHGDHFARAVAGGGAVAGEDRVREREQDYGRTRERDATRSPPRQRR